MHNLREACEHVCKGLYALTGPLPVCTCGTQCKVCAAAQSYNGAWYYPTQHSIALHHWALHYTIHMAQVLVADTGETLIGYIGKVINQV